MPPARCLSSILLDVWLLTYRRNRIFLCPDIVQAYKSLQKEKDALEKSMKALVTTAPSPSLEKKKRSSTDQVFKLVDVLRNYFSDVIFPSKNAANFFENDNTLAIKKFVAFQPSIILLLIFNKAT